MSTSTATAADIETGYKPIQQTVATTNPSASTSSSKDKCLVIVLAIFFVLLATIMSTFIGLDFWYAYHDISCQHDVSPVGITLADWLMGSGIIGVFMFHAIIATLFYSWMNYDNIKKQTAGISDEDVKSFEKGMFCFKCWSIMIEALYFCWVIVGTVLFWRDVYPTGDCGKQVGDYVYARLIIAIITIAFNTNNRRKK